MARWRYDEARGKDVAIFRLEAELDRIEDATIQAWRRDNKTKDENGKTKKPTVKEALAVALQVGLQELGAAYDPTRKK